MGLRATPEFANEFDGTNRHAILDGLWQKRASRVRKFEEKNENMSEETKTNEEKQAAEATGKNQVALEMMKFIAVNTGYGKGVAATGFAGKSTLRSAEDHAEALLELFKRCRDVVNS